MAWTFIMYPITSTLLKTIVMCVSLGALLDAACPPGKHPFTNCTNPCEAGEDTVLCQSDHTATCRPDYCGGCIGRFYNGVGQEVHCERVYGFICELKSHTIGCLDKPGTVLHISYANYGRFSTTVCVHPYGLESLHNTTTCGGPRALGVVRQKCEGQKLCTLKADNDIFGDPCFGIYKYLEVEVECVLPDPTAMAAHPTASFGNLMMTSFLVALFRID